MPEPILPLALIKGPIIPSTPADAMPLPPMVLLTLIIITVVHLAQGLVILLRFIQRQVHSSESHNNLLNFSVN